MGIGEEEKWRAVLKCDESYDGKFFYGVKTTGIFCRPSCKSRNPRRENVEFFDGMEKARASGLRPCKRCRPDLLQYEPSKELFEKAKNIYDSSYDEPDRLKVEVKGLNISQNHLIRLFRSCIGITPVDYLNRLRIEKAMKLLSYFSESILDIALLCGFKSLSNFYDCFKKHTGLTPGEYRKRHREG